MKQILSLFFALFLFSAVFAQKGSRPYYGGGRHTSSHGGSYPGSVNAHHKGGHYKNYSSGNRYGIHLFSKRRKS